MSDMRLKMIPAALAAVGMMTAGVHMANASVALTGIPAAAVYTNSLFAPTNFITVNWNYDTPVPAVLNGFGKYTASATQGMIALVLKGGQSGWGFHITDSKFDPNARGTHTLTATYTATATGTATCTLDITVDYDTTSQVMGVSFSSPVPGSGTNSTACSSRYSTLTGVSSGVFGAAKQTYNLIY